MKKERSDVINNYDNHPTLKEYNSYRKSKAYKIKATWEAYAKNKVNSFFEERMEDVLNIVKLKKEDLEDYNSIKREVFQGFWNRVLHSVDVILETKYSDIQYDKIDTVAIDEAFLDYFDLPNLLFDLFSITEASLPEERRKLFIKIINQRLEHENKKANHSEFKILWSAEEILSHLHEDDYYKLNPFYKDYFTYLILSRRADELFLKSYSHKKRNGYMLALRDANDDLKIYSPEGFKTNIVQISAGYKSYRAKQKKK